MRSGSTDLAQVLLHPGIVRPVLRADVPQPRQGDAPGRVSWRLVPQPDGQSA
jgi:hypothetical protein